MTQDAKRYQLNIFGELYTIISDESEAEILKAASYVNSLMKEISEKSGSVDSKKIAVLVALKLSKQVLTMEMDCKKLKEEESNLINKIDEEITLLSC